MRLSGRNRGGHRSKTRRTAQIVMNNPTPYDARIAEIEADPLSKELEHALDMRRAYRLGEKAEAQRHAEVSQAARDGVTIHGEWKAPVTRKTCSDLYSTACNLLATLRCSNGNWDCRMCAAGHHHREPDALDDVAKALEEDGESRGIHFNFPDHPPLEADQTEMSAALNDLNCGVDPAKPWCDWQPRRFYIPNPPWQKGHPGQEMVIPKLICDKHPHGCDISGGMTKVELEMVKVDAPGPMVNEEVQPGRIRMVPVPAPGFKGEHTGRAKLEIWPDHDLDLAQEHMCKCAACTQKRAVHPGQLCPCVTCQAQPEHYWTADPSTCPCAICDQARELGRA